MDTYSIREKLEEPRVMSDAQMAPLSLQPLSADAVLPLIWELQKQVSLLKEQMEDLKR